MKRLTIERDITIPHRDEKIAGGWQAYVPEIRSIDVDTTRAFSAYFRRLGMSPQAAEQEALARVQATMEGAWITRLRQAMRRWATDYIERFGDLGGFDPEYMSAAFVPAQNYGRPGNPYVGDMFAEMRSATND